MLVEKRAELFFKALSSMMFLLTLDIGNCSLCLFAFLILF
jgi:hypothetical protein